MRKHFSAGAATAALVLGLALVAACAPPPPGPGTTPTTTTTSTPASFTVTGRMVDSVRGTPVAGVTVKVTNLDELAAGALVDRFVTSAADGTFSIDAGAPSTFWLFAITAGLPSYGAGAVRCVGSRLLVDPGGRYCDFNGGNVGDVHIDWKDPWTFFGQVFTTDGTSPVANAKVVLTDASGTALDDVPGYTYTAFTDASGKFGFTVPNAVEEFGVLVDGSGQGFETGYLSFAPGYPSGLKKLVLTQADACAWGPLSLGAIGLNPL